MSFGKRSLPSPNRSPKAIRTVFRSGTKCRSPRSACKSEQIRTHYLLATASGRSQNDRLLVVCWYEVDDLVGSE